MFVKDNYDGGFNILNPCARPIYGCYVNASKTRFSKQICTMEKEVNPDVVKATQASLGKYVKRPPLTDKLLKKPPFRFLHDIITSVMKSTGFFNGLFEEEELISDNVKDRESKILFLNKVITVLSTTTGTPLSIKPSKIIAGQEPEKTNEMLQCLAQALDDNLSSDEAVKLYKESVKSNAINNKKGRESISPTKKHADSKKLSSKSSDKLIKTVKSDTNTVKNKQRENINVKKEPNAKKPTPTAKVTSKKGLEKVKQTNDTNKETKSLNEEIPKDNEILQAELEQHVISTELGISHITNETPQVNDSSNDSIGKEHSQISPKYNKEHEQPFELENNVIEDNFKGDNGIMLDAENQENVENKCENKDENSTSGNQHQAPESPQKTKIESIEKRTEKNNAIAHNIEHTYETKVTDNTNMKIPSSMRPSSSRPGAPRFREKHDSMVSNNENLVGGKVNIIAERTVNEEEDEPTIIVIDDTDDSKNKQDENIHLQASSDQHGHLVQQILDAQKEFTQAAGKTEIEWHFGAQKARDVLNQEIEQIRFNVQALSRAANPLGKLLDHIQEDVEVMRQELHQWTTAYDHASNELSKQKIANEEYLLPLYARIKQLDMDIAEKHDKINDLKVIIHKNASRIDKLLSSGNV